MKKNAVELTLNTIIIAIIVLLVLVLLAYLLLKGGTGFNTGTACFQAGGTCKKTTDCIAPDYRELNGGKDGKYSCGNDEYCCKPNS